MSDSDAEAVLYPAFCEEAERYEQALVLAEQLIGPLERGESPGEPLLRIGALMSDVAAIEARIAPVKQAWIDGGRLAGARLQSAAERLDAMIDCLAELIRGAETIAMGHRDRILQELDSTGRSIQMQSAYRGTMRKTHQRSLG